MITAGHRPVQALTDPRAVPLMRDANARLDGIVTQALR